MLDFFDRYVRGRGDALLYDDGFRRWSYTSPVTTVRPATGDIERLLAPYAHNQPVGPQTTWTNSA